MNSSTKIYSFIFFLLLSIAQVAAGEMSAEQVGCDCGPEPKKKLSDVVGKHCVVDQEADKTSNLQVCECLNKQKGLLVDEKVSPTSDELDKFNEEVVGQHLRSLIHNSILSNFELDSRLNKGVLFKGLLQSDDVMRERSKCNIESFAADVLKAAECGNGSIGEEQKRRLNVFFKANSKEEFVGQIKEWGKLYTSNDKSNLIANECINYRDFVRLKKGGTDNKIFIKLLKENNINGLSDFKKFMKDSPVTMNMSHQNLTITGRAYSGKNKIKMYERQAKAKMYNELLTSNPLLVHAFKNEELFQQLLKYDDPEHFFMNEDIQKKLVIEDTAKCQGRAENIAKIICADTLPPLPMDLTKLDQGVRWMNFNRLGNLKARDQKKELAYINEIFVSKMYCQKADRRPEKVMFDQKFKLQSNESDDLYGEFDFGLRMMSEFEQHENNARSDYEIVNKIACRSKNYCEEGLVEQGKKKKCERLDYNYKRALGEEFRKKFLEKYSKSDEVREEKMKFFFDKISNYGNLSEKEQLELLRIYRKLGYKRDEFKVIAKIWNFNKLEGEREIYTKLKVVEMFEKENNVTLDKSKLDLEKVRDFDSFIEANKEVLAGYPNFQNFMNKTWTGHNHNQNVEDGKVADSRFFSEMHEFDMTEKVKEYFESGRNESGELITLGNVLKKDENTGDGPIVEPTIFVTPAPDVTPVVTDVDREAVTKRPDLPKISLGNEDNKNENYNNSYALDSSTSISSNTSSSRYDSVASNVNTNSNIGKSGSSYSSLNEKKKTNRSYQSKKTKTNSSNTELDDTLAQLRAEANAIKDEVRDLRNKNGQVSDYNSGAMNTDPGYRAPSSVNEPTNNGNFGNNSVVDNSNSEEIATSDQFDNQETSAAGAQSVTGGGSSGGTAASSGAGAAGGAVGGARGLASGKDLKKNASKSAFEYEKVIPHSAIIQQSGGLKELVTVLELEGKRFSTYENKDGETIERVYDFHPLDSEGKPKMMFLKSKEKREKLIKTIDKLRKSGTSQELLAKVAEQTRLIETKSLLEDEKDKLRPNMISEDDLRDLIQRNSKK